MYLTKGEFLQKFGILPQEFEEADISWEELLEIADDYERRRPTLVKIRKEFVAEFLQDKEKEIGLQSYHSRLKDTEHLVEKLVRKRLENYAKYRKMDATNYMRYVTDLIGIRGLLLYREDWVNFHKYIIHWFKNDPEKYIRDYGRDYDQNASGYMAEPPESPYKTWRLRRHLCELDSGGEHSGPETLPCGALHCRLPRRLH